jgi:topoisomerase-4 subunit A
MKQKSKGAEQEEIILHEFIGVKSYKAKGKRLTTHPVKKVGFLEPLTIPEKVEIPIQVKPEPAPKKKPEKKELKTKEKKSIENKPKEIKPAESSKKESSKKGSKRKHSGKKRHDKGVQMELPL